MDGVVINSEPSHLQAFRQTFQPLGIRLTDEQYQTFFAGKTDEQGFVDFLAHIERPLGVRTLQGIKRYNYQKLVETTVEPYPTTVTAISRLALNHPLALVTSSPESQVSTVLRRFNLNDHFSVLVTAESVSNSKPDPESYLKAAERLGKPAADCIAVEDAPSGIVAAKRAGMYCVALTTTHAADQLAQADRVVDELYAELFASL